MLPYPFSKYVITDGKPVFVPENIDEKILQEKQLELEAEMDRITQSLDRKFGYHIDPA